MFWDASAVVPALVSEARSAAAVELLRTDRHVILWWVSPLECQSALYRQHREEQIPLTLLSEALARLRGLVLDADFIAPTLPLRDRAARLVASHPLRAADALQLAAALVWCEEAPQGAPFVCLDDRLREAARREGFIVLPE